MAGSRGLFFPWDAVWGLHPAIRWRSRPLFGVTLLGNMGCTAARVEWEIG